MGAVIRTANQFKNSDFPTPRGYEQAVHEKSLALARNFSTASHITDQLTKELFFFFSFLFLSRLGVDSGHTGRGAKAKAKLYRNDQLYFFGNLHGKWV